MEQKPAKKKRVVVASSAMLENGGMAEIVYLPEEERTAFLVHRDGDVTEEPALELPSGRRLVPFSPMNNLLTHNVVLLPSQVEEYGETAGLVAAVESFIHRHVDLSPAFEAAAVAYVLFSWVYDSFNELPYLRVRGDFGSGKSRFLETVGSLCYKPIFASGASTVSPLFRILDAFRGTLVFDEADFRASDEKAEIVKILNNGNARGFPVLRSEATPAKEYNPRAFAVFGPKLIATRAAFDDRALESRCLTEDMGQRPLRSDIPLNLTASFKQEARSLRNKLLLFRFRNARTPRELPELSGLAVEPRVKQVLAPLFAIAGGSRTAVALEFLAIRLSDALRADRASSVEGEILEVIRELRSEAPAVSLREVAHRAAQRFGERFHEVTPRWIGSILRKRLGLTPRKSHGTYVLPLSEYPKLDELFSRYGLGRLERGTLGNDVPHRELPVERSPGGTSNCD